MKEDWEGWVGACGSKWIEESQGNWKRSSGATQVGGYSQGGCASRLGFVTCALSYSRTLIVNDPFRDDPLFYNCLSSPGAGPSR